MSWLDKVTPTNLLQEKEKFLADNSYNPQFIYEDPASDDALYKLGLPQKKYWQLAQHILDKAFFGRNEHDLLLTEGSEVNHDTVTEKVKTFLQMHDLQDRFEIVWSSSFVSRASINKDTIKLRSSAHFYQKDLIGLIYHEVGTHAIRTINYEQQDWYKHKTGAGLKHNYLRTEEGLAVLHQLLPKNFKIAYPTAIRYCAAYYAQSHTFAELWKYLGQYIQDPETRWMVTFRQKRGISDTSQPGGSTKDIVYFEGLVNVWKWLMKNNCDLESLYLGKISYEDVTEAKKLSGDFQPLLPSFFTLDKESYQQTIQEIGELNELGSVK